MGRSNLLGVIKNSDLGIALCIFLIVIRGLQIFFVLFFEAAQSLLNLFYHSQLLFKEDGLLPGNHAIYPAIQAMHFYW